MSEIKRWEEAGNWVVINYSLCQGIAKCVEVCPMSVYSLNEEKVVAEKIGDCIACGACREICPEGAILEHWAWT
jgi:NAD-dependent dihydropyrimidine dehydrogenase PreA subunit